MGILAGSEVLRGMLGETTKSQGHGFIVHGGIVFQCARVRTGTNSAFFEEVWMMVVCLSVWHIWTRRCKFVFQRKQSACCKFVIIEKVNVIHIPNNILFIET